MRLDAEAGVAVASEDAERVVCARPGIWQPFDTAWRGTGLCIVVAVDDDTVACYGSQLLDHAAVTHMRRQRRWTHHHTAVKLLRSGYMGPNGTDRQTERRTDSNEP